MLGEMNRYASVIPTPPGGSTYTDSNGATAPIPKGFEVSTEAGENIVDEGLVIKNSTDANEFVWIPVYNMDTMVVKNNGVWGRLYALESGNNFNTNLVAQTYSSGSILREPDILADYDEIATNFSSNLVMKNGTASFIANGAEFKTQLEEEFNAMIASVTKYQGFYVGRYETSLNGTIAQSQKNKTVMTNINWYKMYQNQKSLETDSVVSGMIWGCQFDQALKFVEKAGHNIIDSRTWGNHLDSESPADVAGVGTLQNSGFSEYWKACNIYDLAGNVFDWTMEAKGSGVRVGRRGETQ